MSHSMPLRRVTAIAMVAALSYAVFTFLQIKLPLPGGGATSLHLGNAVCVLGALVLGGFSGGLGGAIGMTIGDLLDPVYIVTAPKTFVLKLCIGLVTGFVAHRLGHIDTCADRRHVLRWAALAAAAGLLFNVVADPLVGYAYNRFLLGRSAAEVALVWNVASTSLNAAASAAVSVAAYMALRPVLGRLHLNPPARAHAG